MSMHPRFDKMEAEIQALSEGAIGNADDRQDVMMRLDRLINEARGARFKVGLAHFGAQFTPAAEEAPDENEAGPPADASEPPARKFGKGDSVRTKEGYLGRVGYYDSRGRVVVNVVYQAAEYQEADLRPSPI